MRSKWNTVYFIFLLYVFVDIYTFFGLKSLFPKRAKWVFSILYIFSSIYIYFGFYQVYLQLDHGNIFRNANSSFYLGLFLTALVGKLVFVLLLFLQDFLRLILGGGIFIKSRIDKSTKSSATSFFPARRKFITATSAILAAIPFSGMLYGITKGKYQYTVNKVKLNFTDLPPAFEGFRIVQISDIHAGSLDDISAVAKGVQMVNDQNPDVIVMTGDLINSEPSEIDPFISTFKKLNAKHGKFSSLGNHDYYGLSRRASEEEERIYMQTLQNKFDAMDIHLMNNTNTLIEKDGEKICLLGVENWGKGRWFPKKGDLDLALQNLSANDFCVLLSHDPTHWDEKILPHSKQIHLTLSGHTHGFQFGINMPGFKWSPAQYRYPRWIGLHEKDNQYLYINQGFGYLAFPGRVGIWPEITVIELGTA